MPQINSVKINNNNVNFKYGLTITDILNQDLNTGVLVIPNEGNLDIEPFDLVEITYEVTKQIKMYVGTINSKISKFNGTKKYLYEIGLVSLATKLQRIILPNKTITQSLDGTQDKTIKTIIEEYLSVYASDLTLSTPLIQKLGSTIAPEQQWSRPTLFEVLNDLLKPIGCVATMTDVNIISFLDLDEEGSVINEDYINNYEVSQDIREYSSAIEIDASNVYDRDTLTRTPERYTTRTTQQGLMTTDNQEIILNKPIFEIKKVILSLLADTSPLYVRDTIDITDRVVNKKVWDSFYPSDSTSKVQDTSTKKYKRNYLWFQEGSNVIEGLSFLESDWFPVITFNDPNIENVIYWAAYDQGKSYYQSFANTLGGFIHDKIGFYVEYTTTDNVLFRVRKEIQPRNESVLINSQTNANVYAKALGKQQQEFVNRIGNKEMVITGRYENYNDIPNLKDYINNYVLVEREIQFNESHYNFKGKLSENYSKDNMFAGINTAKRYNELASISEATISNNLTENFYRLEKVDDGNTGNIALTENYLIDDFGKTDRYIQGAIVQTMYDETAGSTSNKLLLETTPYLIGNSALVTLRMSDNYNSHLRLNTEFSFTGDKHMMDYVPYTDDNGRFDRIAIRLYKYNTINTSRGFWIKPYDHDAPNNQFQPSVQEEATLTSSTIPEINETYNFADGTTNYTYDVINDNAKVFAFPDTGLIINGGFEDYVKRYKDNREITAESLQFTILGSDEVFLKDKFYEFLPIVYRGTITRPFKIAYSYNEVYNVSDKVFKGTLINAGVAEISTSGNQLSVIDVSPYQQWSNLSTLTSWAICDYDGNILIAVNGDYTPLYLNKK